MNKSTNNFVVPGAKQAIDKMKYEIAQELGLFEKVQDVGWKGLSSRETGKIGGILATRKKHVDT